jgi:hypothetical protein
MLTQLPAEVIASIADSSPHRSRMIALSCLELKEHKLSAVIHILTLKIERLEASIGNLVNEVAQTAREFRIEHGIQIIDSIIRIMRRLRMQSVPPSTAITVTRGPSISRIWEEKIGDGFQSQIALFMLSTESYPLVRVITNFALGPNGMMRGSHNDSPFFRSSLEINTHDTDMIPTCGEIVMEGMDENGLIERVEVSFLDNRVLEALKAIGFY